MKYKLLILHEGLVLTTYRCPAGRLTVGVGHNLDAMPINGIQEGSTITEERAMEILKRDVDLVERRIRVRIPWFDEIDVVRQTALIDMGFNMGVAGLMNFRSMLAALQAGRYAVAARHLLDSQYASQVKGRAYDLAYMIEAGRWPERLTL